MFTIAFVSIYFAGLVGTMARLYWRDTRTTD